MVNCINCMWSSPYWYSIWNEVYCPKMKRVILWGDADCPKYYSFEQFEKDTDNGAGREFPISPSEIKIRKIHRSKQLSGINSKVEMMKKESNSKLSTLSAQFQILERFLLNIMDESDILSEIKKTTKYDNDLGRFTAIDELAKRKGILTNWKNKTVFVFFNENLIPDWKKMTSRYLGNKLYPHLESFRY